MSPRTLALTLALTLTALVGTASAQPAEDVESLHRRGELRTAAWATAGVAVAFLGAGAVATGLGGSAAARWNSDACLGAQGTRGETCPDAADTALLMRPFALVGFVTGALVAVTSVALFIVSGDRPRAATAWRCGQGPGTVGLSCGASF